MKILVSACLLGENCKYNGGNNKCQKICDLASEHEVIPVCPEVLGGLSVPRSPAEIVNGKVTNADGISVDREFRAGAEKALEIAKKHQVDLAILQSRSPSCGLGEIYDGTFTKRRIKGNGVFVQRLLDAGIRVMDVAEYNKDRRDLYQSIREQKQDVNAFLVTMTDGQYAGEKLYVVNDQVQYVDTGMYACQFWEQHREKIRNMAGCSLIETKVGRAFVSRLGILPRLIICGGGHVSQALVKVAKMLNFEVWVIEDRLSFADQAKAAGADHVICDNFESGLGQIEPGFNNYFVCMTRGHRFDQICLNQIMGQPFAYVGMMGSRRRSVLVRQDLIASGFSPESVEKLHAPIGLAIQAQTPEEIAVSVAAELIRCKNADQGAVAADQEILQEILDHYHRGENDQKAEQKQQNSCGILCTIIDKRGSAPRTPGTQMMVCSDSRIIGTVGGGCAEAEVISECRRMLQSTREKIQNNADKSGSDENRAEKTAGRPRVITVNMTTDEAEEEGMVCGGTVKVLLEYV